MTVDRARGRRAAGTQSAAAKRKESTTAAYAPPKNIATQKSQKEPCKTAREANNPTRTPDPVPVRKAARRPWRRAMAPAGRVQAAMPTTKIEIGRVASAWLGARMLSTIAPVEYTIAELAPPSACAIASLQTSASPERIVGTIPVTALAFIWDMRFLRPRAGRASACRVPTGDGAGGGREAHWPSPLHRCASR